MSFKGGRGYRFSFKSLTWVDTAVKVCNYFRVAHHWANAAQHGPALVCVCNAAVSCKRIWFCGNVAASKQTTNPPHAFLLQHVSLDPEAAIAETKLPWQGALLPVAAAAGWHVYIHISALSVAVGRMITHQHTTWLQQS